MRRTVARDDALCHYIIRNSKSASSGTVKKAGKSQGRSKSQPKTRRGPQGYIEELVDEGFFKRPRTLSDVKAELANRGHHIARTSLSGPLQNLCKRRRLRRQKGIGSDKDAFGYTNW